MTTPPGASPILVTGATGLIGREVLRQLLGRGEPVIALARARGGRAATDRVRDVLGWVSGLHQLDVVEADLSQPACGLADVDWGRLRARVETVIHCAGDTAFFPADMTTFRRGHIDGPLALLQGLRGGRLRQWAHLSTAYVCGRRSGMVLERDADVGQSFHNAYERVKLESETLMRRAGTRLGVDLRVFRPSIVVGAGPPTAGARPSNLFFGFVRMAAALAARANGSQVRLRIAAAPRARLNLVPVEDVAAATIALSEHPTGTGETFHLVASDAPTQEAALGMIADRVGLRGLTVVDARETGLPHASPLERQVARLLTSYQEYLEQDVRFDDATARRLLGQYEACNADLEPTTMGRLIELALAASPLAGSGAGRHPATSLEGESGCADRSESFRPVPRPATSAARSRVSASAT
jgi:thioester reductase-like protein